MKNDFQKFYQVALIEVNRTMKISDKFFLFKRKLNSVFSNFSKSINLKGKPRNKKLIHSGDNDTKEKKSNENKEISLRIKKFSKQNLLFFAIIFSIVGILALFLFSFFISPKYVQIEDLSKMKNGAYVNTTGYIKEINDERLTLCSSLSYSSCAVIVLNQGSFVNSKLLVGDYVSVTGTLSFFNKKPYIYVSNVKDIQYLS